MDSLQKKLLDKHHKDKQSFSFDGWYENDKFAGDKITTEGLKEVTVTAEKTFYGRLKANQVTVTFNTDGGPSIPNAVISYNSLVSKPDTTREGWIFNGFFKDESFTEKFDFDALITANTTVYLKWTIKTYTVTFNTGAGASTVDDVSVNHGTKISKPTNPTKTGNVFIAWFKENTFQTRFDFAKDTITGNTTLYASFGHIPTDITLSANAPNENQAIGTVIGNLSSTDVDAGETFTYSLVAGDGDDNNANFTIDGNKLKSGLVFDFETKTSYKIRIRTTDSDGATFEKKFTISINNLIESISYAYNSGDKYVEETANDGSIDATKFITVTVENLTFRGNAGDKLTLNTDFTAANVPFGLKMAVTKLSGTTAKITFTGRADSHTTTPSAVDDNVNDVTITFQNSAFVGSPDISRVATKTKNDIKIGYTFSPPVFIYHYVSGDGIYETTDGNISEINVVVVSVRNGAFITSPKLYTKDTHYSVANVPAGLSPKVQFQSKYYQQTFGKNVVSLELTGTATSHAASDDVNNLTITFKNAALQGSPDLSGVATKTKNDINVLFDKEILYIAQSENKVVENTANSGTIEAGIFSLVGQNLNFNTSVTDGDTLTADDHYTFTGLPAGLSITITKYANFVNIKITGTVTGGHTSAENTTLVITFENAAFQNIADASTIIGNPLRIPIEFKD